MKIRLCKYISLCADFLVILFELIFSSRENWRLRMLSCCYLCVCICLYEHRCVLTGHTTRRIEFHKDVNADIQMIEKASET